MILLQAMAAVLAVWVLLGASWIGLGFGVRRAFGLSSAKPRHILMCFWIGWALTIEFVQIWHLWLPVTPLALVPVLVLGLVLLTWGLSGLHVLRPALAGARLELIAMLVVAIWLSNQAIGPPVAHDTGLYHLNAVRWASSYPIVPGLAHLHRRLGFNSSHLLYVAMLDTGRSPRGYHLANGVLLFAVLAQAVVSLIRLLKGQSRILSYDVFNVVLLPPLVKLGSVSYVSSPAPDACVFILGVVLASQLFLLMSDREMPASEARLGFFAIVLLGAVSVTVKTSTALWALGICLAALGVYCLRGRQARGGLPLRVCFIAAVFGALAIVPWLVGNVILSGWPLYPAPVGGLPVEWCLPRQQVADLMHAICSYARMGPDRAGLPGGPWDWVGPWFQRMVIDWRFDFTIPVLVVLGGGGLAIVCRLGSRKAGPTGPVFATLGLVTLAFLAFWFLTAPDPRFVGAALWVLAANTTAFAVEHLSGSVRRGAVWGVVCMSALLCLIPLRHLPLNGPGCDRGCHPPPKADLVTYTTTSGLTMYVPAQGDKCWDAPLPCTPERDPNLRLRRPGNLGSGFVQATEPPP